METICKDNMEDKLIVWQAIPASTYLMNLMQRSAYLKKKKDTNDYMSKKHVFPVSFFYYYFFHYYYFIYFCTVYKDNAVPFL